LALMCPDLVLTEKKKIERYIKEFPKRIKGNITSSKPTTLHDAINMARELVEQAVQGRAAKIGENNKRKWEDDICLIERIEKTKRSKNSQKPTRNEKKDKDKNKSEETAKDHSRISPTQQERQSKEETMKPRANYDKL
ncbi:hypothetical protein Tco_0293080, partial [Tanacetum coccineum]